MKFTDLEEAVNSKVILNPMPFDVHVDFVKVTSDTVLVPITIQMKNRDITFVNKDGVQRGTVNIFARLSTLTGKIVQTFEDTVQVDVPAELLPTHGGECSVYSEGAAAAPRPLQAEHRSERRERRPQRRMEPQHRGSGISRTTSCRPRA